MFKLNHAFSNLTRLFVFIPFLFIFVTVFIIDNRLANGLVSGKYYWFYAVTGLIAITAMVIAFRQNKRLQLSIMDGFVLLFLCTSAFSANGTVMEVTRTKHILFVLIILLYFYLRLFLQTNRQTIYWILCCFILTGLGEAIWGLRQLYGYEQSQHNLFRITGSFFNPGPYACYIAVVLPMAFHYMLKYRRCCQVKFHLRNWPVYILWSISLLTVIASILILPTAMSRTSWIAAMGGCGAVFLFSASRNKKIKSVFIFHKKISILTISFVTLLVISGSFGMYKLKKDSADGRAFIWKNTIELIKKNPLGVGLGYFSGSYGDIQAEYFEAGKGTEDEKRVAGNPEYAFNEYLQICAEQGVIAFLLFIGIVGCSLYIGIKRKKNAPIASLSALLIAAGTSYPFRVLPFLTVLVFLLALIHDGEKGIAIPKPATIAFTLCSFVIVSLCLYNRYPTYDAYKKWNRAKILHHFGNQKNDAEEYGKIYPHLSDQVQFLFEYAQCLSKSEQFEESNQVLKKAVKISCDPMLYNVMGKNFHALKQYVKAEQCFTKSSHIVPNRVYPHYLAALMYMDAGETEKAKGAAQMVLTKKPKVQSTAIREMRDKMKKFLNAD